MVRVNKSVLYAADHELHHGGLYSYDVLLYPCMILSLKNKQKNCFKATEAIQSTWLLICVRAKQTFF